MCVIVEICILVETIYCLHIRTTHVPCIVHISLILLNSTTYYTYTKNNSKVDY